MNAAVTGFGLASSEIYRNTAGKIYNRYKWKEDEVDLGPPKVISKPIISAGSIPRREEAGYQ